MPCSNGPPPIALPNAQCPCGKCSDQFQILYLKGKRNRSLIKQFSGMDIAFEHIPKAKFRFFDSKRVICFDRRAY